MIRFWKQFTQHFKKSKQPLDRRALGQIGEDTAVRLLISQGYRIIERNVRSRIGEIDIVARQGKEVVFVEVKTRTDNDAFQPSESVGRTKQRKLCALADNYIAHRIRHEVIYRFDIVEIWLTPEGKVTRTNILANAFRTERR